MGNDPTGKEMIEALYIICAVLFWLYACSLYGRVQYQKGIIAAQRKRILELQGMNAEMIDKEVFVHTSGSTLN